MNTQSKRFDLQSARAVSKQDNLSKEFNLEGVSSLSNKYSLDLSEEFTSNFFDESSKAWMLNKRRCGASYIYVCGKPKCRNKVKGGGGILCKYHAANIGLQETPHIQVKGFDSKPMNEWLDSFSKAPTLTLQKVKEQPN
jgi:hypothetical protein